MLRSLMMIRMRVFRGKTGRGRDGMHHPPPRYAAACVKAGYELKKLEVLDMLPQTANIETLALLGRQD